MTILYIHGLSFKKNSSTSKEIESLFKDTRFISPKFNLIDFDSTISSINKIINKEKPDLIIAHSLGGYYTMFIDEKIPRILLNPCCNIQQGINAIAKKFPFMLLFMDLGISTFGKYDDLLSKKKIDPFVVSNTIGIFSKNDELFSHKDFFQKVFGNNKIDNIPNIISCRGQHKPTSKDLEPIFKKLQNKKNFNFKLKN